MLIYTSPTIEDEDAITEMYCAYLNNGPAIRAYIRAGLYDPGFVGVKCVDDETGKLVGILCGRPGIDFTCPHPELEAQILARWGKEGAYTGDMLVVDPAYQGRGIAKQMAIELRPRLMEKRVKYFVQEHWIRSSDGHVPAQNPMKYTGHAVVVAEVPNFYYNLEELGMTCPECGPHCKCGAIISVIEFRYPPDEEVSHGKEAEKTAY